MKKGSSGHSDDKPNTARIPDADKLSQEERNRLKNEDKRATESINSYLDEKEKERKGLHKKQNK